MGYYAHIRDHDVRITNEKRARKLLNDAGFEGDDFIDCLVTWGYEDVEMEKDGSIITLIFNNKYRGDENLWHALAPVIDSAEGKNPAFIEWQGEDNELWRFVFEDGAMTEVGCDITWPYLGQVRKAPATVDPLTLEGRAKELLAQAIERHIDFHIKLDGMKQGLVAEAQMTLKSVQDAEKVVLNVEVVQ